MTEYAEGGSPPPADDFHDYLRLVSLTADGTKILLNDEPWMAMALPVGIYRIENRQKKLLIRDLILTGCERYNLDYVSNDTITKLTDEVVSSMYQRATAAKKERHQASLAKDAKTLMSEKMESDETTKIITYLVNEITNTYTFKSLVDTGEILYYEDNTDGTYHEFGESVIKKEVERLGGTAVTEHMKREVVNHIRDQTLVARSQFNSDPSIINVKNGLLNIYTLELKPHSPEHLSTIQYPVEYDPNAVCPETEKFLIEVIQDSFKLRELLKFWGYLLVKDCRFEKGAMFVGGGANGKGTLIKLMEAHEGGYERCSHVSLHDLGDDRFATAQLWGKTLNTYADLKSDKIKSTGNLKTIISGDSIEAQHKHKPRFRFRNNAKIVYSSNSPPETDDKTYAFYRRWLIIAFDRTFVNTKDDSDPNRKDSNLIAKLTTPQEMSGALNLRVKFLKVLIEENGFEEESFEVVKRDYESRAEHVLRYLRENCVVEINDFESKTERQLLYYDYIQWCKEHNITALHETTFGSKLIEQGIQKKDRGRGSKRAYYYIHVKLDSEDKAKNMKMEDVNNNNMSSEGEEVVKECQHCKQQLPSVKELQIHTIFNHPKEDINIEEES